MNTNRNKQLARLHILLKELGAEDEKQELYADYGVESSRDMTDSQLADLITRLDGRIKQWDEAVRTLRHNALILLTEMGVYHKDCDDSWGEVWERVNEFLKADKIAKKALYELSVPELQSLIRQLRSMKAKGYRYKKSIKQPQPKKVVMVMTHHLDAIN